MNFKEKKAPFVAEADGSIRKWNEIIIRTILLNCSYFIRKRYI